MKTAEEDPTCCNCQEAPSKFFGLLTPPPKVNAWEERTKRRREISARLSKTAQHDRPLSPEQNLTLKQYSQAPPPANRPSKPISPKAPTKTTQKTSPPHSFKTPAHDPDVIALRKSSFHNFNLPNYKIYRTDRLTHRGGGTAMLKKNSIPHHVLDIKPTGKHDDHHRRRTEYYNQLDLQATKITGPITHQ
ncbi:hypothetical protein TNCV_313961 [Trichonephila clavipes]|nr:hypothetical protein TNCV_313961 [Trichonephila clavipes]